MTTSVHLNARAGSPDFGHVRTRVADQRTADETESGTTTSFHSFLRQANSSTTEADTDSSSGGNAHHSFKKSTGADTLSKGLRHPRVRSSNDDGADHSKDSAGGGAKPAVGAGTRQASSTATGADADSSSGSDTNKGSKKSTATDSMSKSVAQQPVGEVANDSGKDTRIGTRAAVNSGTGQTDSSTTDADSSSGTGTNKDQKNFNAADGVTVPVNPVHVVENPRELLPLIASVPVLQSTAQTSTNPASTGASTAPAAEVTSEATGSDSESTPPIAIAPPKVDASDAAPLTSAGPLAFAAKLSPDHREAEGDAQGDAPDTTPESTEAIARSLVQNASSTSTAIVTEPNADKVDSTSQPWAKFDAPPVSTVLPAQMEASTPSPVKATPAHEQPSAARMEPLIQTPAAPSTSTHDITVRIPDATERGMDVRFVDRGGEVHVSVRTSDTEMAQTLRGGLNDFVGRMEHAGMKTEVWRPGTEGSLSQNQSQDQSASQNSSQTMDYRGGRNQSGSRGSNQQPADQQEHSQNKPRWVEELEASIGGNNPKAA